MWTALLAGAAYFAIVFAVGFVLGASRVLVLVPRIGETLAVVVELPLILAASWALCRILTARLRVPGGVGARLVMGGVAFMLLMAAEAGLAIAAFGRTPAAFVAGLMTLPGAIGLAGQIAFALFPALQAAPIGRRGTP